MESACRRRRRWSPAIRRVPWRRAPRGAGVRRAAPVLAAAARRCRRRARCPPLPPRALGGRPGRAGLADRVSGRRRAGPALPPARYGPVRRDQRLRAGGTVQQDPAAAARARRPGGRCRGGRAAGVRVRLRAGRQQSHQPRRHPGRRLRVPALRARHQPGRPHGHRDRVPREPRHGPRPAARLRRHRRRHGVAVAPVRAGRVAAARRTAHRAPAGAQPPGRVPARVPARLPARRWVPGARRDGRGHLQRRRPALRAGHLRRGALAVRALPRRPSPYCSRCAPRPTPSWPPR